MASRSIRGALKLKGVLSQWWARCGQIKCGQDKDSPGQESPWFGNGGPTYSEWGCTSLSALGSQFRECSWIQFWFCSGLECFCPVLSPIPQQYILRYFSRFSQLSDFDPLLFFNILASCWSVNIWQYFLQLSTNPKQMQNACGLPDSPILSPPTRASAAAPWRECMLHPMGEQQEASIGVKVLLLSPYGSTWPSTSSLTGASPSGHKGARQVYSRWGHITMPAPMHPSGPDLHTITPHPHLCHALAYLTLEQFAVAFNSLQQLFKNISKRCALHIGSCYHKQVNKIEP